MNVHALLLCIASVIGGAELKHTEPFDLLEVPTEVVSRFCRSESGCYLKRTRTERALIVLREDWRDRVAPHNDTFVHELTHHVQAMQGEFETESYEELQGEAEYAERAVPVYCDVPWH